MGQQFHHDMVGHFLYPGCRFLSLTFHEGHQLESQLPFKSSCITVSHSLSLFAMSKQFLFSGEALLDSLAAFYPFSFAQWTGLDPLR